MGGGKIKNKDQLSLAEARVEAELGKMKIRGWFSTESGIKKIVSDVDLISLF